MSRYLAIDHGGTKTELLVFDEKGEVVCRIDDRKLFKAGERRGLKWHQRVRRLLASGFRREEWKNFDSVLISLNGIDTESDRKRADHEAKKYLNLSKVRIVGDGMAALRGTELKESKDAVRVVICAGSGLNVSLKSDGHPYQSLGCRINPHDHGGYGIGRGIWSASLDAYNGLGKPTMLMMLLQKHFRCETFPKLLESVSCGQIPFAPEEFAPLLFIAAHKGDSVAVDMVDELARRWIGYADLMLRECCENLISKVRIYLSGGIFKDKYGVMVKAIRKHVGGISYSSEVKLSRFDPVVGGVMLMLESLYADGIPQKVLVNFQRTLKAVNRRRYG